MRLYLKNNLLFWILGFLCLNLYVHLLPLLFTFQVLHWFVFWIGFFLLAYLLGKYALKLSGLQAFGLTLHRGWFFNISTGFLIGFACWALKYFLFYNLAKFQLAGLMESSYILPMLAQAFLAMFFASAINDLLIRGYWLAFLRKEELMKCYIGITTILYALDDCWNERITGTNLAFSAVLGISLAYSVRKTGSVWMCIGIHWGSNMMYRVMYGLNGQGIWKLVNVQENVSFDFVSLLITALLFPLLFLLLKVWPWKVDERRKDLLTSAAQKVV